MKKVLSVVSLICVLNALMLVGMVGFLVATNRLDKAKAQAIGDLLRQQGSPEDLREKLYEVMSPAPATATASAPATRRALAAAETGDEPASAQERIDYVRKVLEEERLRLDNDAQDLRHRQELLKNQQAELDLARQKFAVEKKAYEDQLAAVTASQDKGGFEKSMAVFDELKPRQVKDLLAVMPPDDIARYLAAMEPDRAAKVISEFKSTDEKSLINGVVDRLRGASRPAGTGAASAPAEPGGAANTAAAAKAGP